MKAGRAEGVFLLITAVWVRSVHSQCLSTAVPAADRRNVTIAGESMPLGIYPLGWSSAAIYANIFKILTEEVLGYNTVFSGGPGPAPSGIWGLAGCENAASTGCTLTPGETRSVNHLSFEIWDYYVYSALSQISASYPMRMPVLLGNIGFDGMEANFIPTRIVDASIAAGQPALDFYRNYNASWYNPSQFFSTLAEIDTVVTSQTGGWQLCSQSGVMGNSAALQQYIDWFGDAGGTTTDSSGNLIGNCYQDIWWTSASCRNNVALCVPYLTYNGWGAKSMMHKSALHNVPIAIASVGGYSDWITAVRAVDTLTYWWTPDTSFIDMDMVFVQFPPYNAEEHAIGYQVSEFLGVGLEKWAHAEIEDQAPMVWSTASNIQITLQDMDMMLRREVAQGLSAYQNACQFLQSFDYTAWIPNVACFVGQGMLTNDPADGCDWCAPSTYSAPHPMHTDMRLCTTCPAGRFNSALGRAECRACTPGRYSLGGVTSCSACDLGRFQGGEGSSGCDACGPGLTTELQGQTTNASCVCPANTYPDFDGTCRPCPPGMICALGNSQPILQAGNWADGADVNTRNYDVYRCRNIQQCLQRAPGANCAANREGRGCSRCKEGTYPEDNGACAECEGPQFVPIILCAFLMILVIIVLCIFSAKTITKQNLNNLTLLVCLGQLPLAAQVFTVFAGIEIEWISPMDWFLRAASALSFNIEVLNVACIVPETSSVGALVFKLMIYPICICVAGATAVVLAMSKGEKFGEQHQSAVINTAGVLFFTFYIALTILSASPFYCLKSPNGISSIRADPSVLCIMDDGNYVGMAIVGAVGLAFYCVFFFGAMTFLVLKYPAMMMSPKAYLITQRYRFLFLRFKVERYFYGPVVLARGVLIAFIPIIFADRGTRQVLAMAVTLIGFGGLQSWLQPWRTALPNCLDSMMSACLLLILVGGGMTLGLQAGSSNQITDDMQIFFTIVLLVLLIAIVGIIGFTVYRGLVPRKKYSVFLSHHKGGCAIGARFMKSELKTYGVGGQIFLDSDELDDLENVLDIVRSMTEHLVILLTSDTLKRPWCAGEIAMGFLSKTHTVCMNYDDYKEFTEEELVEDNVDTFWSAEAWAMVTVQGVTTKDVCDAYLQIIKMPKIPMKRVGLSKKAGDTIAEACAAVASEITGRSVTSAKSEAVSSQKTGGLSLALLADNSSGEAVSFAQVLARMIKEQMQTSIAELFHPDDVDMYEAPRCLLTSLTGNAFTSTPFALLNMKVYDTWGFINTVTTRSPDFIFPPKAVFEESICPQVAKSTGCDLQKVREAYSPLVSILAMGFDPTGNLFVMTAECKVIVARLSGKVKDDAAVQKMGTKDEKKEAEPEENTNAAN